MVGAVGSIGAGAAVSARNRGALVDVGLTLNSAVPDLALTRKCVQLIDARRAVTAGFRRTLVDVGGAIAARIPMDTCARVAIHTIGTCSAVFTRLRGAFVRIGLTPHPDVTRWTLTQK